MMYRAALLIGFLASVSAYDCTYQWNGVNYDASPLQNSAVDYHAREEEKRWDFFINVCQPGVTQLCGPNCAVCEQWSGGVVCLGNASTASFQPPAIPGANGQGFTIQFTDGIGPRSAAIDFTCDPDAGVGSPVFYAENPSLHFKFQWKSKYACAASPAPPPPPPPPPPADCYSNNDCGSCTGSGCYWCLESEYCVPGPVDSSDSKCSCWVGKRCPAPPACASMSTCGTCAAVAGCVWCLGTNGVESCLTGPVNSTVCADAITLSPYW
eukprot:TRINITY_DN2337_c0_g1_i1.p1 TRINITY_DN2337_c0_g1~~TRINITY_DN2337_c0_g1_i1.p1  ORF type:complete len:267 (+),score=38.22 TRINITY_DN2337_c0_g1_i1:240-1040(+)